MNMAKYIIGGFLFIVFGIPLIGIAILSIFDVLMIQQVSKVAATMHDVEEKKRAPIIAVEKAVADRPQLLKLANIRRRGNKFFSPEFKNIANWNELQKSRYATINIAIAEEDVAGLLQNVPENSDSEILADFLARQMASKECTLITEHFADMCEVYQIRVSEKNRHLSASTKYRRPLYFSISIKLLFTPKEEFGSVLENSTRLNTENSDVDLLPGQPSKVNITNFDNPHAQSSGRKIFYEEISDVCRQVYSLAGNCSINSISLKTQVFRFRDTHKMQVRQTGKINYSFAS